MSTPEWNKSSKVCFQVADRSFFAEDLCEMAMIASGNEISAGYFKLIELPISMFFFTVETWERLAMKRAKQREGNSNLFPDSMEWEDVDG